MWESLHKAVSYISALEKEQALIARYILDNEHNIANTIFSTDALFPKVSSVDLSGIVAATDSGFTSLMYRGASVILHRAITGVYTYKKSVLSSTKYYPEAYSFPDVDVAVGSLLSQTDIYASLLRLKDELQSSINVLTNFELDFLFLDGSLILQRQNVPLDSSDLHSLYMDVLDLYTSLYDLALEKNTFLCGIVEDSTAAKFCNLLSGAIPSSYAQKLRNMDDVIFLGKLLPYKHRTLFFEYADIPSQHKVLSDMGTSYARNIYAFYIRSAQYDLPLRVEFLSRSPDKDIDTVSSAVLALSHSGLDYAQISPLIDIDLHAKLKVTEIEHIKRNLSNQWISNTFLRHRRRDSRPFR